MKHQIDIDYVANLARIAISEEEKETFSRQLSDILGYIEKLNEVDITGIEPMAHAFPVTNVWADDLPSDPLPVEVALSNAYATRDNMIIVPKVVE